MVTHDSRDKIVLAQVLCGLFNFSLKDGHVDVYVHPGGLHVCLGGEAGEPYCYKQCDQNAIVISDNYKILPHKAQCFTFQYDHGKTFMLFKIDYKRFE